MPRKCEKARAEVPRPHLRYVGLTKRTVAAYSRALLGFFDHLHAYGLSLPSSESELDDLVAECINVCWQEGEPHGYVGHLLSGLHRFCPSLRRRLPTSWMYFTNWQRVRVPARAVPLPTSVAIAMGALAYEVHRVDLAALVLLGFVAFLRTSDIVGLAPETSKSPQILGWWCFRCRPRKRPRENVLRKV